MKIVIGYEGSSASNEALKLAKKHAKAFDAKVYVLTSMVGGSKEELQDVKKVQQDLENAKTLLEKEGISCETHQLVHGLTPGEDLVQFVEENNVDEIIIGIIKKSKMQKLVFGSTAQYVILKAPCPVVTVK